VAEFLVFDWKKSEIALVMTVLAVILGISGFQLRIGQMKTRDAQRKADTELVGRAMDAYFSDHGFLPLEATGSGQLAACGRQGKEACLWGEGKIVDEDNVAYLEKLPIDPLSGQKRTYIYQVNPERSHYQILVALENRRDNAWKKGLTAECGAGIQCNWYVER
jgi:hypothetical protein